MTEEKESRYEEFYSRFGGVLEEIRRKTLLGDFWGKYGAVSIQKQIVNFYRACCRRDKKLNDNRVYIIPVAFLFSAASSTYYAAGGNAFSHIGQVQADLFSMPLWFWRGWKCLRKAEKYSDEFAKLKPMKNMTLGELDTRACILSKRGRRNEAAGLLSHGIKEILTKQTGTKHDLCLFLVHESEIISSMRKYDKENKAEANYQQAMKLSEDEAVPALTKVRVMKSYGKFLAGVDKVVEAKDVLNKGLVLAEENNLDDQVVKIKALLARIR